MVITNAIRESADFVKVESQPNRDQNDETYLPRGRVSQTKNDSLG